MFYELDRVQEYLDSTVRAFKRSTTKAMQEAAVSVGQTVLLLSVGGGIMGLTIGAAIAPSPPPRWVLIGGGTISGSLLIGGAIRSIDALADVNHAAYLNAASTRNRTSEKVLDAGLEYVTHPDAMSLATQRVYLEHILNKSLEPPQVPPSTVVTVPPTTQFGLIETMIKPRSCIIVGKPGSGKGYTVSEALKALRATRPEVQQWVIDPKQDPSEDYYWSSADRRTRVRLDAFSSTEEVTAFQTEVDEFLEEFKRAPNPKLLVLDEALSVKQNTEKKWYNRITAGFNTLCGQGRSRGEYGWVITQSPNVTDLNMTGGVRSAFTRILLVHTDDRDLVRSGSTFASGEPGEELFNSPSRRAYYLSTSDTWGKV